MSNAYSEDALVEQPAIELLRDGLKWDHICAYEETHGEDGLLGRENRSEVVLRPRLLNALNELNPSVSKESIFQTLEEVCRDRSSMSPVAANREVYELLKSGRKLTVHDAEGNPLNEVVRIVDWNDPLNNDFLVVNQLWVTGAMYTRRPDAVGFVNGIPLLLCEFKKPSENVYSAFEDNLRDYKDAIPQLLWYNAVILLSNGSESKVGTLTSEWEHFGDWKRINDEGEKGVISLDTALQGVCEKTRFLNLVENFVLYSDAKGGTAKLLAKNHQFLGVQNAVQSVRELEVNQGQLGVFWHTQGSGKSYSMIFFAQMVLRKLPGNWSFVVVTDRTDLDDQIYKNFANCGVLKKECQAESAEHLKQLLTEDHRYIFTLIQKFKTDENGTYPELSDRSNIIVITDEAHRSQYDTLALNMRRALPNAAFIGFTGTPLMAGEEKTREVFGDYVSVYDFKQSIEDGATVPLYYENRIPELELINASLDEDLARLLEDAELDEAQEKKLEREFKREYHLITRDDRLDAVAEDIVQHFLGRGHLGKAMVVSIDKVTAVKMYDRVKAAWDSELNDLKAQLKRTSPVGASELVSRIQTMEETDMAVVVSQGQNEVDDFRQKGLDIASHRKRMLDEDLETAFKNPQSHLRIVFVCAMWTTGFDVPSCSTIYVDKPMKNHTLMQTISRANRVFGDKISGTIVDYAGVFRNLQKALAIYGQGRGGGEFPVLEKSELVKVLKRSFRELTAFFKEMGISFNAMLATSGFEAVSSIENAADAILEDEERKKDFISRANHIRRLYKAILPDTRAEKFQARCALVKAIHDRIRKAGEPVDITHVIGDIEKLLDESISPRSYEIHDPKEVVNLAQIDFEKLRKKFKQMKKGIQLERLKAAIEAKLFEMMLLNKSRIHLYDKYQEMIADYNSGSKNLEELLIDLIEITHELNEEEKRTVREGLTEEELAVFDLLTQPEPTLTKAQEVEVKKIARELLVRLRREKLVLDWRKKQQTRALVKLCIEEELDSLPKVYTDSIFLKKADLVYQHVYDSYFGAGQSLYECA